MFLFFILENNWVSSDDPTINAENELLGAAKAIDATAKEPASLHLRRLISNVMYCSEFKVKVCFKLKTI